MTRNTMHPALPWLALFGGVFFGSLLVLSSLDLSVSALYPLLLGAGVVCYVYTRGQAVRLRGQPSAVAVDLLLLAFWALTFLALSFTVTNGQLSLVFGHGQYKADLFLLGFFIAAGINARE